MSGPVDFGLALPACPNCGGDLVAYRTQGMSEMLWACRACGATFSTDPAGLLRPVITELFFPACPDCGSDMLAVPSADGDNTHWRCPTCKLDTII